MDLPTGGYIVSFSSPGSVCDDPHPLGGWLANDPQSVLGG
jgi:hypothetical protein